MELRKKRPKKGVKASRRRVTRENPRKPEKTRNRKPQKEIKYLTVAEKDRLFKAIDSTRDRAIFRILYHHGLRAGEIGKLEFSDYRAGSMLHLDRLNIHRLKGSISGETGIVPIAAQALRAWLRKRGQAPGPLFPSKKRTPITRWRIFQLMRKYCEIAGIPRDKAHPHCLKHSTCTHLLSDKKEPITDIQRHVGHKNIASTMIYAQLTGEANDERIRRLRDWK